MKVEIGPYTDENTERKIDVQLHDYDTWSLDHTLSYIIHPALIQLKETNHGMFYVDDEDVPKELRSGKSVDDESDEETEAKYNWVMDEMIHCFSLIVDDSWEDVYFQNALTRRKMDEWNEVHVRIKNGTTLFGKYYRALWD